MYRLSGVHELVLILDQSLLCTCDLTRANRRNESSLKKHQFTYVSATLHRFHGESHVLYDPQLKVTVGSKPRIRDTAPVGVLNQSLALTT